MALLSDVLQTTHQVYASWLSGCPPPLPFIRCMPHGSVGAPPPSPSGDE